MSGSYTVNMQLCCNYFFKYASIPALLACACMLGVWLSADCDRNNAITHDAIAAGCNIEPNHYRQADYSECTQAPDLSACDANVTSVAMLAGEAAYHHHLAVGAGVTAAITVSALIANVLFWRFCCKRAQQLQAYKAPIDERTPLTSASVITFANPRG